MANVTEVSLGRGAVAVIHTYSDVGATLVLRDTGVEHEVGSECTAEDGGADVGTTFAARDGDVIIRIPNQKTLAVIEEALAGIRRDMDWHYD